MNEAMTGKEHTALVIGGGPAGIEAALKIARGGYRAVLVEKESEPGGIPLKLFSSFPRWENPSDRIGWMVDDLKRNKQIEISLETTVESAAGTDNGFNVTLKNTATGDARTLDVQAVVLATGFRLMDLSAYGEYGHRIYPGVLNSLEFEERLREWSRGLGKAPQAVALIQCVGSRDRSKGYPYCSKICCMYSAKQAGVVKDLFPEAKVYVFYIDCRAAGKGYEEFLREVIEKKHVRYVRGRPAKVLPEGGRLLVRAEDTLIGIPVEFAADVVVLAAAVVPHPETAALAKMFGASIDEYGFIDHDPRSHAKCADRVFFAGGCGFAVDTESALSQGAAAAAEVIALFNGNG
ncbi:MAG: CoB--CoM heterodisulfide reductase iron-sulfur subunit A family protein [Syntrophobacterales bacterium]|nr:CoB--CoM heterodisulfide reductase iron-sulfur subunit A family protein [Syntrophobacterales bacterium]